MIGVAAEVEQFVNQHESLLWILGWTDKPLKSAKNLIDINAGNEEGFFWAHLRYDANGAMDVMREIGLHEEVIESLTAEETRPRTFPLQSGLLVILRCVNHSPQADPEDMLSLRLWITKRLVISARRRDKKLLSIEDVKASFDNATPPKTTGEFTALLTEKLADRVSQIIDAMDEDLSQFEAHTDDIPNQKMRPILTDIRRQAASIRRYLAPQREALETLARSSEILDTKDQFNLKQQSDRTVRYIEDLDLTRERATLLQDELRNKIAESQNVRMYLLSLATVIFLPLSFLTGIFGMNVAGLPGTQNEQAFIALTISMVVIALLTLVLMRIKHWL